MFRGSGERFIEAAIVIMEVATRSRSVQILPCEGLFTQHPGVSLLDRILRGEQVVEGNLGRYMVGGVDGDVMGEKMQPFWVPVVGRHEQFACVYRPVPGF